MALVPGWAREWCKRLGMMRRVLVEYARRRGAAKREAVYKVTLDGAEPWLAQNTVDPDGTG